jgi:membrane protein
MRSGWRGAKALSSGVEPVAARLKRPAAVCAFTLVEIFRRAVDLAAHFVSVSQMASNRFPRLIKILAGAVADADEIFQLESRLERFVYFWALVTRQFIRHRCLVRASALSYSTLLAIIPLLAVALSVTSSLLKDQDEAKLNLFVEKIVASVTPPATLGTNSITGNSNSVVIVSTNFSGGTNFVESETPTNLSAAGLASPVEPVVTVNTQKEIARQIHSFVQNTSSGALGITGMIFLVFTAISLLRGIEETFNDIWGVTRGRNWRLQIMLYWTIITLGPLLLVTALGLTGSVHLQHTRSLLETSPLLAPVFVHVLPITIVSVALALFYKLTPNTKVEFRAALLGGFFAGTAWHFYNQLGFLLAARAVNASKIYGSLALVVLLMGGLYIVWLILLFGAQIAYAYQNRAAYLQDRLADNVNQRGREFVALRIMTCLGQRFQNGLRPATVPQLSAELGIPSRLTQSVLRTLVATQLVTEVSGAEAAFAPARPLDAINAYDILIAMRTGTGQELPLREEPALAEIYGEFARIEQAERAAAAGITLLALTNRVPPRAALAEPQTVAPEKTVALAPVVEKIAEPERVQVPPPAPIPEKNEEEIATPEPVAEQPEPRREVVRPEENTDFPL